MNQMLFPVKKEMFQINKWLLSVCSSSLLTEIAN